MLTLFTLTGLDLYSSITTVARVLRALAYTIVNPALGKYMYGRLLPEKQKTQGHTSNRLMPCWLLQVYPES